MKVHLIEHAEYNDKQRNIVYHTDQLPGASLRANHAVNVWYSKGAEYVDVPNLANLPRDEAEQKLSDAGLKLGQVTPGYSDKVPVNYIISQDVSFKKRVFHDTTVDLIVSDGPKPDYADSGSGTTADTGASSDQTPQDTTSGDTPPSGDAADTSSLRTCRRSVMIPHDRIGQRRVRIEYSDDLGAHPAIVDEMHSEGDTIPIKFDYYGKDVTLTIYYDNELKKTVTFDPQVSKRKTFR
jgi:hypothetical protein